METMMARPELFALYARQAIAKASKTSKTQDAISVHDSSSDDGDDKHGAPKGGKDAIPDGAVDVANGGNDKVPQPKDAGTPPVGMEDKTSEEAKDPEVIEGDGHPPKEGSGEGKPSGEDGNGDNLPGKGDIENKA